MKLVKALLLSVALSVSASSLLAHAAPAATPSSPGAVDKGWFYFDDPKKQDEEPASEPTPSSSPQSQPTKPKDDPCKKKDTWNAKCGFVNPGEDFDFQAKERDALLQRMTVAQNDPKAVEAFQYYMHWVLERTSEVTNLWWYNMTQNPELDPASSAPISAMGLRLMMDVHQNSEKQVFQAAKEEGGMFVVFTRSDCEFCHQMTEPLKLLQQRTGLPVRDASLDDKCLPDFPENCMTAPDATPPAQALQVATVPTVFLYVKPNTWIRVANGFTDADSMTNRAMQFFSAYRNALLKGEDNSQGGRPSVDFNFEAPSGNTKTGIEAAPKGAGSGMPLPSEDDIAKLLGEKK